MAWYEPRVRPIPQQIARNFALWIVGIPIIMVVVSPIGDVPLPDAAGWTRLAMFGLPFVLAGAIVDAYGERASTIGRRALGQGFATALVMFVLLNGDRFAAGNLDLGRMAKGLAVLPVMALFLAAAPYTSAKYLTPAKPPAEPTE